MFSSSVAEFELEGAVFSSSVAEFELEGAVFSCSVAATGEAEVFTRVLSHCKRLGQREFCSSLNSSSISAFADAVASRTILSIASSIASYS